MSIRRIYQIGFPGVTMPRWSSSCVALVSVEKLTYGASCLILDGRASDSCRHLVAACATRQLLLAWSRVLALLLGFWTRSPRRVETASLIRPTPWRRPPSNQKLARCPGETAGGVS